MNKKYRNTEKSRAHESRNTDIFRQVLINFYTYIVFTLLFYLPLIGILSMTAMIIVTVIGSAERKHLEKILNRKKVEERKKKVKQATTSVIAVVTGYIIGYIPLTGERFKIKL